MRLILINVKRLSIDNHPIALCSSESQSASKSTRLFKHFFNSIVNAIKVTLFFSPRIINTPLCTVFFCGCAGFERDRFLRAIYILLNVAFYSEKTTF